MTETIKMAEEYLDDMIDSWLAREKDLSKYLGTYSKSSLTVNDTVLLIESRQRLKEKITESNGLKFLAEVISKKGCPYEWGEDEPITANKSWCPDDPSNTGCANDANECWLKYARGEK